MYQFDDEAKLAAMLKSDALKRLVADFNRDWPEVTRTRETLAGAGVCEVGLRPQALLSPLQRI